MCGAEMVRRPHSPTPAHYICTECFFDTVDLDNFQPMVTKETIEELLELRKRKTQ
jgi:chromosome segregation and condensation protein ScpB